MGKAKVLYSDSDSDSDYIPGESDSESLEYESDLTESDEEPVYRPHKRTRIIESDDEDPEEMLSSQEIKVIQELETFIENNNPSLKLLCEHDTTFEHRLKLYQTLIEFNDCNTESERMVSMLEFRSQLDYIKKTADLNLNGCSDTVINTIEHSKAPIETKRSIMMEYERVRLLDSDNSEKQSFFGWWFWVKQLPMHNEIGKPVETDLQSFIHRSSDILNRSLYGLENVKLRVLALLRYRFLFPERRTHPIGWIGDPGVGKTMLANLVAECEGRHLERLVLTDKGSIDGGLNVWVGSSPGQPVMALCRSKSANCCLLIDEVDKIDQSMLQSLLFILDPDHNHGFVDNFIAHFPVDFSKVCFMLTANTSSMHPALYDRVHWIRIPKYTYSERKNILTKHIVPRINKELDSKFELEDSAIDLLLSGDKYSIRWIKSALTSIGMEKCLKQDVSGFGSTDLLISIQEVQSHMNMEIEQVTNHMYN